MTVQADVDAALVILTTAQADYEKVKSEFEAEIEAAKNANQSDPKLSALEEVAAYAKHLPAEFLDGFNAIVAKVKSLI